MRKTESFFGNIISGVFRIPDIEDFKVCGKDVRRKIPEIRLIIFENLDYGINICQITEMGIWY